MKKVNLVIVILFVLATCMTTTVWGAQTIAILEFENNSGDKSSDHLRKGLRDMLVTDLQNAKGLQLIERARLNDILKELKLAKGEYLDKSSAVKVGKLLGVKGLLTGSYIFSKDKIRIDIKLISPETGKILYTQSVSGKKDEFFDLEKELAENIAKKLIPSISKRELRKINQLHTENFEAFDLYSQAVDAEDKGKLRESEKLLKRAIKFDKNFKMASAELKKLESVILDGLQKSLNKQKKEANESQNLLISHNKKFMVLSQKKGYSAEYFASLIILSVHEGLKGNYKGEKEYLCKYWSEFTDNVPVQNFKETFAKINDIIVKEGIFFQNTVCIAPLVDNITIKDKRFLFKEELRKVYCWPKFATIWPFNEQLIFYFNAKQKDKFSNHLPKYPHQYLYGDGGVLEYHNEVSYYEKIIICSSILDYYGDTKDKKLREALYRRYELSHFLLYHMERLNIQSCDKEKIKSLLTSINIVSQLEKNKERKRKYDKMLLQYINYLKRQNGDITGPAGSFNLGDNKFFGPNFIIIDLSGYNMGGRYFKEQYIPKGVNMLNQKNKLNIYKLLSHSKFFRFSKKIKSVSKKNCDRFMKYKYFTYSHVRKLIKAGKLKEKKIIAGLPTKLPDNSEDTDVFDIDESSLISSICENYSNKMNCDIIVIGNCHWWKPERIVDILKKKKKKLKLSFIFFYKTKKEFMKKWNRSKDMKISTDLVLHTKGKILLYKYEFMSRRGSFEEIPLKDFKQ